MAGRRVLGVSSKQNTKLDAVVVTGGEPTLQEDLQPF